MGKRLHIENRRELCLYAADGPGAGAPRAGCASADVIDQIADTRFRILFSLGYRTDEAGFLGGKRAGM